MSTIRISEANSNTVERAEKLLAGIPGGIWKASYAALRRAGDQAKTKAGQFAAAEYTINKGDFMRNVTSKTSISGNSGGVASLKILYAGNVLPLLTFNTRYSRNGTVQTQVKRHGGATVLEHAFAKKVFGPMAVFERTGKDRFPVNQKFGPSTAHMMQNEQVVEKMDETIQSTFSQRMEHEITRLLNGWGR